MSYTRPCNKCGERISLRQMPAGQWVAFDVSTEESHVCGVKNKPDISVKLKGKKKPKQANDSIDLGYEDNNEKEESKIYDNSSGIHYCIDKAIKEKKRIFIDYYSEYNDESTSREISPIKKYKYKSNNYLQAYCHKRKGERNFLTKSIESATEINKKKTKIKLGKPNTKIIEKMKQENNPYKTNDNTQNYVREYKKDLKETEGSLSSFGGVIIVWLIIGTVLSFLFG
ncbi:WYL domain-containing protein [Candidatus Pelagibacter sp.]|nr:WYL domain-containing protein [Candidatus Pelagibacter sp.]